MIGEELSAESELGQQSVSLCDDSNDNSMLHSAGPDAFAEHTIVNNDENAGGNPEEIVIATQDAAQADPEAPPVQVNGFFDDLFADVSAPDLPSPDLPDVSTLFIQAVVVSSYYVLLSSLLWLLQTFQDLLAIYIDLVKSLPAVYRRWFFWP